MPVIQNQYPQTSCSNCWYTINTWLNNNFNYSSLNSTNNISIVNNFGSKNNNAFSAQWLYSLSPSGVNPSYVNDFTFKRDMKIYSFKTLPFVSSSAGWVNLPTLNANPCPTLVPSTMPYEQYGYTSYASTGYKNSGFEASYIINFPNLTASSDWFQIYTGVTSSNGTFLQGGYWSPTPGAMIYEHSASIGTVFSSSYFVNGAPTLTIDSTFPNC